MLIAIVFADRTQPLVRNTLPYLLPLGDQSVIEHVTSTVLRGPFGATVVVTPQSHSAPLQQALSGFAVQQVVLAPGNEHAGMFEALRAAQAFRKRWETAMAAAAARFTKKPGSPRGKAEQEGGWDRHRQSADVKVRGLARSFDRDGVMLFRAERPSSLELQAQVAEGFGREGAEKGAAARPIAQAVYNGIRGYPIVLSLAAAEEVLALPAKTDFDEWLLARLEQIQDIKVSDPGAVEDVLSDASYATVASRCAKVARKR